MKMKFVWLAFLLAGIAQAQEMELQIELMNRVGTETSRKGDLVSARVTSPAGFQGSVIEGKIAESTSGARSRGQSVLDIDFDRLRHNDTVTPINSRIKSAANSKGQANVDEEGRVIGRSGNSNRSSGTSGLGRAFGGIAGGRTAQIGAAVDTVASAVLRLSTDAPNLRFDAGSKFVLTASSRSGPALASLASSRPAAAAISAPVSSPAAAAASPAAAASAPAAAPAVAPASPPQAAGSAPPTSQQPDLTAIKADFIPGEKVIFFDDFTDMAGDEPPPHWKVRGGTGELRVGQGVRQLTFKGSSVTLTPNLTAIPANFTMEADVMYTIHGNVTAWTFFDKAGKEVMFYRAARNYDKLAVHFKVGAENIVNDNFPMKFDQPLQQAVWCQKGRLRLYVNGQRLFDVNQISLPEMGAPRVVIETGTDYVGFRMVRFAESAPDFSQMISSSGRYVTHGILFDTDSDVIKPESAPVIKQIAGGLETNPNLKLLIEGHTDSVGDATHNLDLSKRRAEAVKAVLVGQFKVDASRLSAAGLGSTKPVDSNDTPQGRAQNRRVELVKQ